MLRVDRAARAAAADDTWFITTIRVGVETDAMTAAADPAAWRAAKDATPFARTSRSTTQGVDRVVEAATRFAYRPR